MPIQLDFTLRRLAELAAADPTLRDRQPYKAAYEGDQHWLGAAMVKHYHGDDGDLQAAHGRGHVGLRHRRRRGRTTARCWTSSTRPRIPTLGRPYRECGYAPMVELLRFLEANGFTTYIASGGDRDFMRPVAGDLYGIPPERVIGSALASSTAATGTRHVALQGAPWTSSTTARRSRCASGFVWHQGRTAHA